MLAVSLCFGVLVGIALTILWGLYLIERPAPQAERPKQQTYAVSTGDYSQAHEIQRAFSKLEGASYE